MDVLYKPAVATFAVAAYYDPSASDFDWPLVAVESGGT